MPKTPLTQDYFKLHFIIFIWGFTGILGKLISLGGESLAWLRMGLAFISLAVYMIFKKIPFKIDLKSALTFLSVGLIIAVHWATFFLSIKVSNVSVALVCMSSSALFMAFLEPFIMKKRIIPYEIVFGIIVILALFLIFKIEPKYKLGIILAIISAFMAALFTALNANYIKTHNAIQITTYEMLGGFLGLSVFILLGEGFNGQQLIPTRLDWIYLFLLSVVCTAYAFVVSVDIMKVITPFTIAISVNLEPIYAIVMALIIFGEEEHMSFGFYLGGAILILTILANAFMKARNNRKLIQNGG